MFSLGTLSSVGLARRVENRSRRISAAVKRVIVENRENEQCGLGFSFILDDKGGYLST